MMRIKAVTRSLHSKRLCATIVECYLRPIFRSMIYRKLYCIYGKYGSNNGGVSHVRTHSQQVRCFVISDSLQKLRNNLL